MDDGRNREGHGLMYVCIYVYHDREEEEEVGQDLKERDSSLIR